MQNSPSERANHDQREVIRALIVMGDSHFDDGRYEEAIKQYKWAIDRDGPRPSYFSKMAACYKQLGNKEKRAHYGHMATCSAVACFESGRYDEAIDKYIWLIDHDGRRPSYYSKMAACYEQLGNFKKMADYGRKCIKADKHFGEGYIQKAVAYKQMAVADKKRNMDDCIKTLEEGLAVEKLNGQPSTRDRVRMKLMKKEVIELNRKKMVDGFFKLTDKEIQDGNIEKAIQLGRNCSKRAASDDVISDCTKLLKKENLANSEKVEALIERAQAFEDTRRYRSALQDVKTVLQMLEGDVESENYKLSRSMQERLQKILKRLGEIYNMKKEQDEKKNAAQTRKEKVNTGSLRIEVTAPNDLKSKEKFKLCDHMGATWVDLQVPEYDDDDHVKQGEKFLAICDPNNVKVNIEAQEDAEKGEEFRAGRSPWQWIVRAPQKIEKNKSYEIQLKNIDFGKMWKFEAKKDTFEIEKEHTGVDKHITQICANMSKQIFKAEKKADFKIHTANDRHEAKIVIFDDHGDYNPSIPAFAVGIINTTMILAWRGTNFHFSKTNGILDVISDLAIGPTMCHLLGKASSGIRMHNAMHSFASTDFEVHGDTIISLIGENKIEEIVFTGHSLGGGIAQCAHPILQAQMDGLNDSTSAQKWTELGNITLRTLAFSAPHTILGKGLVLAKGKKVVNEKSEKLLEKIGKTTVNIVYGSDVIPRLCSGLPYIQEVLNLAAEESPAIINEIAATFGIMGMIVGRYLSRTERLREPLQDFIAEVLKDVKGVCKDFRNHGKVVYYQDKNAVSEEEPKVLTHDQFRKITYESLAVSETGKHRIHKLFLDHVEGINLFLSYEASRVVIPAYKPP